MGILALVHVVVIIVLAGFCIGIGGSFAARPGERKLAVLRPLALALLFAVLSSTFSGLALTAKAAAERTAPATEFTQQVFAGLAEVFVLGIVGFAVLTLTWAFVAIGLNRQD